MTARDHLGVGPAANKRADRVGVSSQDMDLVLRAHVPDASHRVAAASHQHVQHRVHVQAEHPRQVAVVMTNDFIVLQIPACTTRSAKWVGKEIKQSTVTVK